MCPLCILAGEGRKLQTKEHLFTGECRLTEEIWAEGDRAMTEKMQEWQLELAGQAKLRMIWEKESRIY